MIDWDALSIGRCRGCGAAASLFRGLCYECRPSFGYTLTQNGWVLNVMRSMTGDIQAEIEADQQEAEMFKVGDTVVWASGLIPSKGQKHPGFGDVGQVTAIMPDDKVEVKFGRIGPRIEFASNFWPADSLVGQIAGGLSQLAGG